MAGTGGTYALILSLENETSIAVGKLATCSFLPGYYLYAGSALGGLFPRVRRHIEGGKRLHWHVDYLKQAAEVIEVWYVFSGKRLECAWYRAAANMPQAHVAIAGFGSSGCSCDSHLVHFPSMPSLEAFRHGLASGVPETPEIRAWSEDPAWPS
jgi:Uri superfamily endonuclease